MNEPTAFQPAVLMLPTGTADGTVQYRTVTARALMLHEEDTLPGMPQGSDIRAEILIRSSAAPVPGARIRLNGRLLQISSVRICRDLDGRIRCCRCEALSV